MSDLLLVIGRTAKQGVGANVGKDSAAFREATSYVEISVGDAALSGLRDGQPVRLISPFGCAELTCRIRPDEELQPGLGFMPYGPLSSQLMGGETHGTGMPDSKLIPVQIQPADKKEV